mgnify:FL=1
MYTPFTSRHFTTHIDPQSGMKYAVLSTHIAPVQQGFYFVNSGFSDDGRYLWFYCAFPPASGHSMGVVDFLTDEVRHFPDTLADDATWLIDPQTGNVYWGCSQGIFMRTPHPADNPTQIARIPEAFRKCGVRNFGTHLTFTPDRKEIVTDLQTPIGSSVGSFDIVTGEYTEWYRTKPGVPYNHVQCSPVDVDMCMAAHEYTFDPAIGDYVAPPMDNGIYPRLQIITRDGTRRMLPPYRNGATHEWWAPDGKSVFYCNMHVIARNRLDGNEPELVCEVPIEGGAGVWHAHCTQDEKYFILDGSWPYGDLSWWRGCESMVRFYNAETGKIVPLITRNPIVNGYSPENQCTYHIDCHPRFVLNDTMVTFTTTMQGRVDVGVAEIQQLIDASR